MAICVYYLVGRCLAGIKCHHKHTGPAFPTPCKNFVLHNTCTWGARCRYAHPTPVAAEDPDPSRSSCKNFLSRRGCKFGSKCLNYHPGAVKKADPSSIPAPPSTQSTTITLIASKATDIVSSILTRDEFASIALASLTESDSTPDLPSLQSITAAPAGSKATDIANVKLSRDKPASTVSTPSIESKSTAGLSLPQPTMTKTTASKATDVVNVKLSQDKSASEISAPSTEFSSTPDLSLLPSTTTKLAGSKATDTADVKSSDVEVDTMLASLVNPSSDDAATSPPAQTPLSLDRDQMDATYMRNSYDEFNSTKPAPSINPGSNLTAPPSQSLTSVPASLSNTDEIGDASLTDITSVGGSYELVRSTTRSPSLIDSEYDTSLSTVSEEATTTKLVQSDSGIDLADRVNNNQQFNNFADQSAAPLITPPNDSSTGLGLVSAVQSADLDPPTNQLPSFMDGVTHVHSPNDTILSTATEEISISPLITAPINPNIEPTPASAVESTNPDLPANDFFYKLIAASAAADKQRLEETSSISTNDQTTINKLSPSVIDWSAATTPSNLELEGPGIYGREICHSVVLCTWPQEWNIPAFAIVDALTNLASTFGEIVCQPFYRNAGFSHSLQFKFQHPHEAAAASAQLNNQYINVAGTYMSVQTSVTHQITVTYMIPQYIIESLGRHGQGNLYTLFEQNFCQLQWNNFHRYYLSGELVTEVTIMGMYEGQVAQCKAVLEDLIRGRVLTHEEGDNRPLWHDFFHTEEGTKWLREKTEDAFYLRVRAVRMANLNVLMIYGSSELTRNEFGGIVKKKIAGLVEGDKKTAEISAVVAEEVRLMRLRV